MNAQTLIYPMMF
uniref:Uncharacterized protein n=1 Tax=Arundo donax TaxID=35708 RepID=A0A0A9EM44_ARUDO